MARWPPSSRCGRVRSTTRDQCRVIRLPFPEAWPRRRHRIQPDRRPVLRRLQRCQAHSEVRRRCFTGSHEIARMRGQIRAQEREIRLLQRAGLSSARRAPALADAGEGRRSVPGSRGPAAGAPSLRSRPNWRLCIAQDAFARARSRASRRRSRGSRRRFALSTGWPRKGGRHGFHRSGLPTGTRWDDSAAGRNSMRSRTARPFGVIFQPPDPLH